MGQATLDIEVAKRRCADLHQQLTEVYSSWNRAVHMVDEILSKQPGKTPVLEYAKKDLEKEALNIKKLVDVSQANLDALAKYSKEMDDTLDVHIH